MKTYEDIINKLAKETCRAAKLAEDGAIDRRELAEHSDQTFNWLEATAYIFGVGFCQTYEDWEDAVDFYAVKQQEQWAKE